MTYTSRDGFNTHEVHDVREAFKNVSEEIPELGLQMCVDGSPCKSGFKGKRNTHNFFRFATSRYAITLIHMWVRHRKNEPACNVVITSYSLKTDVLDLCIATRVRPLHQIFALALTIVQDMEELADNQAES